MIDLSIRLTQTIAAVCPLLGLSIGNPGDPLSVVMHLAPAATADQIALANSTLASFDWSTAATESYDDSQNPNRATLRNRSAQAIIDIDAYLAISSPTAAQSAAFVYRLGQMVRALINRTVEV